MSKGQANPRVNLEAAANPYQHALSVGNCVSPMAKTVNPHRKSLPGFPDALTGPIDDASGARMFYWTISRALLCAILVSASVVVAAFVHPSSAKSQAAVLNPGTLEGHVRFGEQTAESMGIHANSPDGFSGSFFSGPFDGNNGTPKNFYSMSLEANHAYTLRVRDLRIEPRDRSVAQIYQIWDTRPRLVEKGETTNHDIDIAVRRIPVTISVTNGVLYHAKIEFDSRISPKLRTEGLQQWQALNPNGNQSENTMFVSVPVSDSVRVDGRLILHAPDGTSIHRYLSTKELTPSDTSLRWDLVAPEPQPKAFLGGSIFVDNQTSSELRTVKAMVLRGMSSEQSPRYPFEQNTEYRIGPMYPKSARVGVELGFSDGRYMNAFGKDLNLEAGENQTNFSIELREVPFSFDVGGTLRPKSGSVTLLGSRELEGSRTRSYAQGSDPSVPFLLNLMPGEWRWSDFGLTYEFADGNQTTSVERNWPESKHYPSSWKVFDPQEKMTFESSELDIYFDVNEPGQVPWQVIKPSIRGNLERDDRDNPSSVHWDWIIGSSKKSAPLVSVKAVGTPGVTYTIFPSAKVEDPRSGQISETNFGGSFSLTFPVLSPIGAGTQERYVYRKGQAQACRSLHLDFEELTAPGLIGATSLGFGPHQPEDFEFVDEVSEGHRNYYFIDYSGQAAQGSTARICVSYDQARLRELDIDSDRIRLASQIRGESAQSNCTLSGGTFLGHGWCDYSSEEATLLAKGDTGANPCADEIGSSEIVCGYIAPDRLGLLSLLVAPKQKTPTPAPAIGGLGGMLLMSGLGGLGLIFRRSRHA